MSLPSDLAWQKSKPTDIFGCIRGVAFVEQHYGIMHTLDFDEAVDSVAAYCRKNGGKLWWKLILTVWRRYEKTNC